MTIKLFARRKPSQRPVRQGPPHGEMQDPHASTPDYDPAPNEPLDDDPLAFVEPGEGDPRAQLFQQGRQCTILREETRWSDHASGAAVIENAKGELEARMALVPAGSVTMSQTITAQPGATEEEIEVQPFLLDVHAVTNARFQKFVDAGGYGALEYWPEEIWPHLIEFKDLTGTPGPRYWRHGRHDVRLADHPVVGVSWYEAQAYALWIGQRLPTEAEWQMAASWHINSSADLLRRFPWGDAMDNTRCNIWSSRKGITVTVTKYRKGGEWTDTEYDITDDNGRPIFGEMPMRVIRGGAFDTYFEMQATSQFRTGQITLARTHNVGIRCAMDLDQASWITGS